MPLILIGNKSLLLLSKVQRPDLMEFLMLAYLLFCGVLVCTIAGK
jgi:hypothetical protein